MHSSEFAGFFGLEAAVSVAAVLASLAAAVSVAAVSALLGAASGASAAAPHAVAFAAGAAPVAVAVVADSAAVEAAAGSASAPGSGSSLSRRPGGQLRNRHLGWAPRARLQPDPRSLLPWYSVHLRSRLRTPGPWFVPVGSTLVDLGLW